MSAAQDAGPSTTIVFLHHFGGSARSWDHVIGRLRADYGCVAPDLRGFGDASQAGGPYSIARYADDVADLLARLDLERCVLVAHSMGGKIALAFAAQRPPGLVGLVLLAPSPPTPEPMSDTDRARMLAAHGDREAALAIITRITARPLSAALIACTADDMLRSSGQAWAAWLEHGSREDLFLADETLSLPALVVSGTLDNTIPTGVIAREVMPRLGLASLVTVAGSGHLLPVEAAGETSELIRSFLAKPMGGNKGARP